MRVMRPWVRVRARVRVRVRLRLRLRVRLRLRLRLRLRVRLRVRVWVRVRLRVIPGLPGMPTRGRLPPSVLARCSSSVASHCHGSGEDRRLFIFF